MPIQVAVSSDTQPRCWTVNRFASVIAEAAVSRSLRTSGDAEPRLLDHADCKWCFMIWQPLDRFRAIEH